MRFPNAAKGIKKIFSAEIFNLIAIVAFGVAMVLGIIIAYGKEEGNEVALGVSSIGFLVCLAGAAVLAVLALIFKLVGVIQSSKDEPAFKLVLYFVVFGLIVCAVLAIIGIFFPDNPFLYNLTDSISAVISFICLLLIILGVGSLGTKLGNEELVLRSGGQFKLIIWIGILSLFARFFGIFAVASYFAQWLVITLAAIAVFLNVVQYILYLVLLAKAKKALAES